MDRLDLYTDDIASVRTEIAALTGLQDPCLKRLAGVLNRVPDLRGVAVAGEAGRDGVASQKNAAVVRGAAGANADLTQLKSNTTAAVGSYSVLHSQQISSIIFSGNLPPKNAQHASRPANSHLPQT